MECWRVRQKGRTKIVDIFDSVRLVFRRWWLTLPLLMMTVGAALLVSSEIQPEYRAQASVLIVGPAVRESLRIPGEFENLNPLIDQPSALETVATVLALSMSGPEVTSTLEREGLSPDFELGTQRGVPIVLIETRAGEDEVAVASARRLAELIDAQVRLQQDEADVPVAEQVTTSVIQLASAGGADYGGRTRVRIMIFALGVGLTLALVFLLEANSRRRAVRRSQHGDGDDDTGSGAENDDDSDLPPPAQEASGRTGGIETHLGQGSSVGAGSQ